MLVETETISEQMAMQLACKGHYSSLTIIGQSESARKKAAESLFYPTFFTIINHRFSLVLLYIQNINMKSI